NADIAALNAAIRKGSTAGPAKTRSTIFELAKVDGRPRVQRRSLSLTRASAMNGCPDAFWHMRQWQMLACSGGVSSL
ncbi:MAG TPA: hypothetical protein VF865_01455, partial [Acidobacteriaceae bacterium]